MGAMVHNKANAQTNKIRSIAFLFVIGFAEIPCKKTYYVVKCIVVTRLK